MVRTARETGKVVIPWGGGTMMGFGNMPAAADIALDLRGLNQVVSYEPDDLTISAQAGCRIGELNGLLGEHGQFLPFDAAQPDEATIGGLYCTAVSGPSRFGYGSMRDLVIGITSMSADGEISRGGGMVVKNVSGYDMMRLHYGALGSFGVVLQLNFKVLPAPRATRTVVLGFAHLDTALDAALAIRDSSLAPTAMTLLNEFASSHVVGTGSRWTLLLRADGPSNSVDRLAERLIGAVGSAMDGSDVVAEERSGEIWSSVNRCLSAPSEPELMRLRIGTAPTAMADVVKRLTSLGQGHSATTSVTADLGNGLVFASFKTANDTREFAAIWSAAKNIGTHATVISGPVELKREIDVFGEEPAGFGLMRTLKEQFDPAGVFNRGRFIGHL